MPSSQHERYVPKHRRPPAHRASRAAARTMFLLSGAAVVGTGAAVVGGTLSLTPADATGDSTAAVAAAAAQVAPLGNVVQAPAAAEVEAQPETGSTADDSAGTDRAAAEAAAQADAQAEAERRTAPVSRSDRRGVVDAGKQAALSLEVDDANALTRSEDASDEDPRTIAETLLGDSTQFGCLDSLWTKESGWRVDADNPSSSAYGIPQALPGSKMSSFGDDWATNPVTQIRWGLDYIEDRYGSPCGAWSHSQSYNWY